MDQFTIPQFIDVEDKIIGPITTRQFLIMIVGTLLMFITYKLADFQLFAVIGFLISVATGVFAFVKINGMPFHFFVLNIAQTARRPSRRIWLKKYSDQELREFIKVAKVPEAEVHEQRKTLDNTRIRDLSLLVNTGGYYKPDETN